LTLNPSFVASNAWFFMVPFSVPLWLVWACAIVVVAHMLWIMEWDTPTFKFEDPQSDGRLVRKPYSAALLDAMVCASSVLFYTHEPPRGKHSRWFIAVWEYIVLILISAYTANMTSFITNSSAAESVISTEAALYLENSKVITVPGTVSADILDAAQIDYTPCASPELCLDLLYDSLNASLNGSEYNAFVYDDVNVEFWARTSKDCALISGGAPFNSFSAAIALRYDYIPSSVLVAMDLFLVSLWTSGNVSAWMSEFVLSESALQCAEFGGAADETEPLTVPQFWYLWILIAAGSILFCTVVICTVERSQKTVADQISELHQLMSDADDAQVQRVGTLSMTDDRITPKPTPMSTAAQIDLYGDGDGGDGVEMTTMELSEAVEEKPRSMLKQKTQKQLGDLSTLAMDIDPFQEAFDKRDEREKSASAQPTQTDDEKENVQEMTHEVTDLTTDEINTAFTESETVALTATQTNLERNASTNL